MLGWNQDLTIDFNKVKTVGKVEMIKEIVIIAMKNKFN
jgi:hypothetical protein